MTRSSCAAFAASAIGGAAPGSGAAGGGSRRSDDDVDRCPPRPGGPPMVRRGDHAADGSLKSAAMAHTGRGVFLVVVAFLIGVGLLHSADQSQSIGVTQTPASPATTAKPKTTTTVAAPTTTTTTIPLRDPKTVKVLAANGSNTDGIGNKVRLKLQAASYDALAPVTATAKTPTTIVYFNPGFQGEAIALAGLLGVPPASAQAMPAKPPVPQLGTANIVVFAGDDIVPGLTTQATTATTARPAATTTTVRSAPATTASPTTAKPAATTTTTKKP